MSAVIGGCEAVNVRQILSIQRENHVEPVEVVALDLAGAIARNVDAVAQRSRLRAGIGRMADMPVTRAGGICLDSQAGAGNLMPESSLSQRRTTNISKTYEQNGGWGWLGHEARYHARKPKASQPPRPARPR